MPVIQAITISGKIVEEGRWQVSTLENLKEGHTFSVSVRTKDGILIKYVTKLERSDCALEKDQKKGYTMNLRFAVSHFNHMLEPPRKTVDSMAFVVPMNRTVENVFLRAVGSPLADPRFAALLKQE